LMDDFPPAEKEYMPHPAPTTVEKNAMYKIIFLNICILNNITLMAVSWNRSYPATTFPRLITFWARLTP